MMYDTKMNPQTTEKKKEIQKVLDEIDASIGTPANVLYQKLRKRYGVRMTDDWLILKAWTDRVINTAEVKILREYIGIGKGDNYGRDSG